MEFNQYNTTVQNWIQTVLKKRQSNADTVLENCGKIIAYGEEHDDPKLMGFGCFYSGEVYYGLNDGEHFYHMMTQALTYLDRAEEWALMVRCYNFLGIASMSRGNPSIALDYYMNGLKNCDIYKLSIQKVMLLMNMGLLYLDYEHYNDAENAMVQAYEVLQTQKQDEKYDFYTYVFYGNMAECLVMQDRLDEAKPYLDHVNKTEYWNQADIIDQLFVSCVDVIYYHKRGDLQKRDQSIRILDEQLPENLTVLDIFNDFYRCCLVLLETDHDETFWRIIEVLEPQVVNFKIINLHLKLLSLKMKYYRRHEQNAEYLQAAGLYYELSERNEAVTRHMLSSVINLRKNLETMRKARLQAEHKNMVLQERSGQDPLTHMANRFRLNDYVEEVFSYAQKNDIALAMEILDVDYFKEYNDNYGHQEGDRCLIGVSTAIRNLVEETGAFCARYGGDEFVIIYVNVTREQAVKYAEELRRRVLALELEHRFSKALPVVSISQGVCWGIPQSNHRGWDFLHAADNMLYRVKKFSRNNYCVGGIEETEDVTMGTSL